MHIPFPERVPLDLVALFALILFMVQVAEGTAVYFAVGCGGFILIAALAFNTAGGLTRTAGAYVFFYSVLVVIIGICYKALLGEPAQSNLLSPDTDITAYVGSIAGVYAAVAVSSRFRRKSGLLQNMLKESRMHRSSIGCIAFGVLGSFVISLLGDSASRLESAFAQLNALIPLGIMIGVMYEIRRSGGNRSVNLPIVLAAAYAFLLGVTGFSKQGMIMPLFCWALPVCALRHRLSALQIASVAFGGLIVFHYLVPFSQYGRGQVPEGGASFSQRVDIAAPLLEHPEKTRQLYYKQLASDPEEKGLGSYYDTPQGFWERLQFVSADDALINYTNRGHVFGLLPIKMEFMNIVPHALWPNKPIINFGNSYAHEMGGLAEEDRSTGISFSPTGEAYHLARWTGILVIAPLLWCMLFIVFDSLCGDLRASPWGLLVMVFLSHYAPEAGITGLVYLLTFGVVTIVFCAFFATWFAPLFAIPIIGPERGGRYTKRIHKPQSGVPAELGSPPV